MFAFFHHDEDAFEAERESAGRDLFLAKHSDKAVVASAAAERAGEVGDVDFHDRSRVIEEAAGEAGVDQDRSFVGEF